MSVVTQKLDNGDERRDEWAPFVAPILSRSALEYVQGNITAEQYFRNVDTTPMSSAELVLSSSGRRPRMSFYVEVVLAFTIFGGGLVFAAAAENIRLALLALLDCVLLSVSLFLLAVRGVREHVLSSKVIEHRTEASRDAGGVCS